MPLSEEQVSRWENFQKDLLVKYKEEEMISDSDSLPDIEEEKMCHSICLETL